MNSRNKGVNFERLIARIFREKYPKAKRGLQYQEGEHCPDVVGTPYYIECKRGKKYLTVNDGRSQKKYNPLKTKDLQELYNFYHEKMLKYKEMPVLIIWKLDRQPICVFDGEENTTLEEFLDEKNR